jgi:GPH family glycoside/pentoside/hexuronide:cation symporter
MALWFLFNIVRSSSIPVALTLAKADEAFASTMFTVIFAAAAVFFPFVWYLGRRIGKKTTMLLGLSTFAVFAVLFALTGVVGANAKLWALITGGLMGFPVAVLLIVPNVILSELCDADVKKTGERREAMFFGVQGFFMKLNLGVSTAVLALMYSLFGKDISNPLGVRMAPIVGSVVAVIGFFIMLRYPESRSEE